MHRIPLLAAFGLLIGACASSTHGMESLGGARVELDDDAVDDAPPPPPPPARKSISIAEHAQSYRNAQLCEQAARGMRSLKPKKAWALLRGCAHRNDFTQIDRVLNPPWIEDVRKYSKSGAKLVAQIVANRGGNLKLDLGIVNDRGVQLFDLKSAMDNARVFRGRFILLRGKVKQVTPSGGATQVELVETSLQAENIKEAWSWRRAANERRKGRSGAATSYRDDRGRRRRGIIVDSRTVSHETNRRIIGFVERAAEDLKVGEEFLFLIRFDEMAAKRSQDEFESDVKTARAAIVAHYRPLEEGP